MESHEISLAARAPATVLEPKTVKPEKRLQQIMLLLLGLVFMRGLLYGLFIPVDQTPDEKYHFLLIKAKQLALEGRYQAAQDHVAAQIELATYYLLYPENARKRSVADFEGIGLPAPPSSLHIYYLTTAGMLSLLSLDQIRDEIYVVRGFSILCGMVVVLFSFLTAYTLFPDQRWVVVGVPLFMTLIPQFAVMNGAINNDKLAEVFASALFFCMVRSLKKGLTGACFFMMIGLLGLALLAKRSTIFVIPVFLAFLFFYWWQASPGLRMLLSLLGVSIGIMLGSYVLLSHWNWLDQFIRENPLIREYVVWAPAYKIKSFLFRPELYSLAGLKQYAKFFTVLYWSFWGILGYMTIHLHHFWYLLVGFLQGLAVWGLLRFAWRVRAKREQVEPWQAKALYLFIVSLILVIAIPFVRSIIVRPGAPDLTQGRYLFPDIIPICLLTVFGLYKLLPEKYDRLLSVLWIAILLLLDSVCVVEYLCLNFHLVSLF